MQRKILFLMGICSIFLLFTSPAEARNYFQKHVVNTATIKQDAVIKDEIIVSYKTSKLPGKLKDNIRGSVVGGNSRLKTIKVKIDQGQDVNAVISQLKKDPLVENVEYNYQVNISNDPDSSKQWALSNLDLPKAWGLTGAKGEGTVVAVIDTGVDLSHPDLADNIYKINDTVVGKNFIRSGQLPMDDNGHGTHVAGIIAAISDNSLGVVGAAYKTKIMPIKALSSSGNGSTYAIADAITWAADNGAKIINLSLGSSSSIGYLYDAIKYAYYEKGVTIVAAAGNSGSAVIDYPAAYPEVICVGAYDINNDIADFSSMGPGMDISAPGVNIYSTYRANGNSTYAYKSGTSMAAPYAASGAAILASAYPGYSNKEIETMLALGAVGNISATGWDWKTGYGRLNMYEALIANKPQDDYDNAFSQATLINSADDFKKGSELAMVGDEDFYKLTPSRTGFYNISASFPGNLDGVLEIYEEKQGGVKQLLKIVDNGVVGRAETTRLMLQAGVSYYIVVYEYYNHFSEKQYTFNVNSESYADMTINIKADKTYYRMGNVPFKVDIVGDWTAGPFVAISQGEYTSSVPLESIGGGVYQGQFPLSEIPMDGTVLLQAYALYNDTSYFSNINLVKDTIKPEIGLFELLQPQMVYIEANESLAVEPNVELLYNGNVVERLQRVSSDNKVFTYRYSLGNNVFYPSTTIKISGLTDLAGNVNTHEYQYVGPSIDTRTAPSGGGGGGGGGGAAAGGENSGAPVNTPPAVEEPDAIPITETTLTEQPGVFNDIQGHWAQKIIENMVAKGIIRGVSPNNFAPEKKLTRAELCALLVRALKLESSEPFKQNFSDIKGNTWYYYAVNIAFANGLVSGYGESFAPNKNITRQELAAILARIVKTNSPQVNLHEFKDASKISPWAQESMAQMVGIGLLAGNPSGKLEPTSATSRAEAAVILQRLLEKIK